MTIEQIIAILNEHGEEEVYVHIEGYHLHPCKGKEFFGDYIVTEVYIQIPNHIFRITSSEYGKVLREVENAKYWEDLWGIDRTTYERYANERNCGSFPEDFVDPTESDRY